MKEYRIIECCMQRTCMGIYPDLKSAKEKCSLLNRNFLSRGFQVCMYENNILKEVF